MKNLMLSCALMGVFIASGCGKPANQPSASSDPEVTQSSNIPNQSATRIPPAQIPPAQFKMSATDLVNEFLTDPNEFAKKYANQQVEITGVVEELSENLVGESVIRIKVTTPKGNGFILCHVPFKSAWNRVMPGQTARITGRFALVLSNILRFDSCELLEVTGDPPPTVTPDELIKEFTEDAKAANEKWSQRRFLILQGTVKIVTLQNNEEFGKIELESMAGKTKVTVEFGPTDIGDFKSLRQGRKIRLLTEYTPFGTDKEISFSQPRILSK